MEASLLALFSVAVFGLACFLVGIIVGRKMKP
jgi:hypothetical protein